MRASRTPRPEALGMTVYLVSAEKANCPVASCVCAQRVPRYPSDMTDAEWELLEPQARAVMAELRRGRGRTADGAPVTGRGGRDRLPGPVRGGVARVAGGFPALAGGVRVLPTVGRAGVAAAVASTRYGAAAGCGAGRAELPTAAVIDSQSVKAADTVGRARRIRRRKEVQGPQAARRGGQQWVAAGRLVTAASVQDRDGGHRLVALLRERFSTITLVWADGGYAGRLVIVGCGRAGPDRHRRQAHRHRQRVHRASTAGGW